MILQSICKSVPKCLAKNKFLPGRNYKLTVIVQVQAERICDADECSAHTQESKRHRFVMQIKQQSNPKIKTLNHRSKFLAGTGKTESIPEMQMQSEIIVYMSVVLNNHQ